MYAYYYLGDNNIGTSSNCKKLNGITMSWSSDDADSVGGLSLVATNCPNSLEL